jgi:hypothetical protein
VNTLFGLLVLIYVYEVYLDGFNMCCFGYFDLLLFMILFILLVLRPVVKL